MIVILTECLIVAILIAIVVMLLLDTIKLRKDYIELKAEMKVEIMQGKRMIEEFYKKFIILEAERLMMKGEKNGKRSNKGKTNEG